MISLNDIEQGPWNTKNWHPYHLSPSGKVRFDIPEDMSPGDKKALILELIGRFPNSAGLRQIVAQGAGFRNPNDSSTWESELATLSLDHLKYIEFNPKADRAHSKEENLAIFRTFLQQKKTEAEHNHPQQPAPQQQPNTTARETIGAVGEGTMEVIETATEIPVDIALARWNDLLAKISQAETFDELAQNVIFQILFLPVNAINDGLSIISGKLEKWTQNIEKKLDAAKKERLDSLKKGLKDAKKQAEAGNNQKAQELALLSSLLALDDAGLARFKENLAAHPEILRDNPDLQKFLQKPEIQDILNGVRKPTAKPYSEFTTSTTRTASGRSVTNTKDVEMRDGSGYKLKLARTRSGNPPTDSFSYQMDFLMDGKQAHLVHDPRGDGKYTLTCDGKITEYNLKTREVITRDSHGTVISVSRDPDKSFQAIAKQTEVLKKQEEEFVKNLKTLDKTEALRKYQIEYFGRGTSRGRKKEIAQKLKDEWGVTLNDPNNRAEWLSERIKATKEKNTLVNPPPPKRVGVINNQPPVQSFPYRLGNGGNIVGFQVFNSQELREDGSLGRTCLRTVRDKGNEFLTADIKQFDDGSYEMDLDILDPARPASGPNPNDVSVSLKCHKNSSGALEGSNVIIRDGKRYYGAIQNGQISEYICYDRSTGTAQKITLSPPVALTEADLRDSTNLFSQEIRPSENLNTTWGTLPRGLTDSGINPIMKTLDAALAGGASTPHTYSDAQKQIINNDMDNKSGKLEKKSQDTRDEQRHLTRLNRDRNNDDRGF